MKYAILIKIILITSLYISFLSARPISYKDNKLKVEYSFGYILDKEDNLKIIFHHSSIPYNPNNQLSKN